MGNIKLITSLLLVVIFSGSSSARDLLVFESGEDEGGICKSLVEKHPYPCEEHSVTTNDGYILSLQRIPFGHSGQSSGQRQPVLLQHGLMMDASSWLLTPPSESLPYILADDGFDVWLSSSRATNHSLRHKSLPTDSPAYWDWSWDEIAAYDLPAIVNHVHQATGQKLHYVGHSLGTMIALAELSQGHLVSTLRTAALLSPIAYLGNVSSQLIKIFADGYTWEILRALGLYELTPKLEVITRILRLFCDEPHIDCSNLLTALTGLNCCVKPAVMDTFLDFEPQPTSIRNLIHLAQMIRSGKITKYDYKDSSKNRHHYGQSTPPSYKMKNVPKDFALFLAYGGTDSLSHVNDVKLLIEDLKHHVRDKLSIIHIPNYGHADIVIAENANKLIFEPLISFFKLH